MKIPEELMREIMGKWKNDTSLTDLIASEVAEWATTQERERCAKLCDEMRDDNVSNAFYMKRKCAEAIRLPNGDSND